MSYEEREIWRINTENAVSEVCRTYGADVAGSVFQRYEPPWLTTRGNLPVTAPSDRTIDKEFIGNYFFKKSYPPSSNHHLANKRQDIFSDILPVCAVEINCFTISSPANRSVHPSVSLSTKPDGLQPIRLRFPPVSETDPNKSPCPLPYPSQKS